MDPALIKDFDEFVELFSSESERSAVILGSSKIDQQLYFILKNYLLPPYSAEEDLLEGDNRLSTFSARINLCQRLGIIDNTFTQTLHQVRKIRNDFAHKLNAQLNHSPVREHVRFIIQIVENTDFFNDVLQVYFLDQNTFESKFYASLTLLAIRLITIASTINQISCLPASILPSVYELRLEKGK